MTTILFGTIEKKISTSQLSKTLVKLLYGVHDLEVTLVRFDAIFSDELKGMENILAEFDAHVGDCGCQLRAQMILSLVEYYSEVKRRQWIDNVIQILRDMKTKILVLYSDLRRLKGNFRLLGLSSSISLIDLFDRIGCKPFFMILDNHSSTTDQENQLTYSDSENNDKKSSSILKRTCHHRRIIQDERWNLSDYRMVTRFLCYCRLLSLYKTATLQPGATRIRYRLDPLFAFFETERQLDLLNLIDGNLLSKFIAHNDRPSHTALIQEIENMQISIAQLSCDWIIKLSHQMILGDPIEKLLESSIRISTRQLHCMPAYASILVIRFEWFIKKTPLFLLVRRFCTQGYHNAFYRVSVNPEIIEDIIEDIRENNSKIVDLGNIDWFNVISVPLTSVFTEDWARLPHVIIISNSIAGNLDDFYIRMSNDNHCGIHSEFCAEYDHFIKNELVSINFSQAIIYYFGAHNQYPFDLPGNEDEFDLMERTIDSSLGHEAAITYRKTVDQAWYYKDGCTALGFLGIQHIFSEYPLIVARQTEQLILQNEKPAPYGYRWAE